MKREMVLAQVWAQVLALELAEEWAQVLAQELVTLWEKHCVWGIHLEQMRGKKIHLGIHLETLWES